MPKSAQLQKPVKKAPIVKAANDEAALAAAANAAATHKPGHNSMAMMRGKAEEAIKLKKDIDELEKKLAIAKEDYRKVTEDQLPSLLQGLGMTDFGMEDGTRIEVEEKVYASIKKENQNAAYSWLRKNKLGDIIKNTLSFSFGKGEDQLSEMLIEKIHKDKKLAALHFDKKATVHAATLNALANERHKDNNPLPTDIFGTYVRKVAKILTKET